MNETILPLRKNASKVLLIYFFVALTIILSGATGYFYYQYQKLAKSPAASQLASQEEAQKLATEIGKLMLLPKDEAPTVATVTDIEKLKDQPFFKNATNGNKVLIYPNSKLAIIYDPEAKLIVNVGPINFAQTNQAQKTRIGLRNGTDVSGLTYKLEASLKTSFSEADFVLKDNAKRTDYEKTIIVILNESSKDAALALTKTLNAQIDKLPDGEIKPEGVDILIIIGKDKI